VDEAGTESAADDQPRIRPSLKERLQGIAALGRYFKLPKRAAEATATEKPGATEAEREPEEPAVASPRAAEKPAAKPVPEPAKPVAKPSPNTDAADPQAEADKPARRGLESLLGRWRRSAATGEDEASTPVADSDAPARPQDATSKPKAAPAAAAQSAAAADSDDDSVGESDDSIDWASMNKAERRRLKRELRRSGDAA